MPIEPQTLSRLLQLSQTTVADFLTHLPGLVGGRLIVADSNQMTTADYLRLDWEALQGGRIIEAPGLGAAVPLQSTGGGVLLGALVLPNKAEAETLATLVSFGLDNARRYELAAAQSVAAQDRFDTLTVFVANMSHELRTPLSVIMGYVELICQKHSNTPLVEDPTFSNLQAVLRNSRHLARLLNDLLDFFKLEARKMTLQLEAVDAPTLASEAVAAIDLLAQQSGVNLQIIALKKPFIIEADVSRLRQILYNLLGNAIKFAKSTVTLCFTPKETTVLFAVHDDGVGLAAHQVEEIFQPFQQTEAGQRMGGTGLGLPIARQLAELHGGRLWAESEGLELGAVFYLEMPIQPKVAIVD